MSTKGLFTWTRDSELPRGNHCPGASVTSRSHDLLSPGNVAPGQPHCPGASSRSSDHFKISWISLLLKIFQTNCYREWSVNTITLFWCFPELFIWKYIPNVNNEHAQDYSCPGATFAFCSHGEKLPRQGGLPGVVQRVTRLAKLPRGNEKLMWTVTIVRPCTEAKLTPGQCVAPGQWVVPGSCEQALTDSLRRYIAENSKNVNTSQNKTSTFMIFPEKVAN